LTIHDFHTIAINTTIVDSILTITIHQPELLIDSHNCLTDVCFVVVLSAASVVLMALQHYFLFGCFCLVVRLLVAFCDSVIRLHLLLFCVLLQCQ
jgi:hypothetical protein